MGQEPHRHHGREVERSDRREYPYWLANGVAIDPRGDVLERAAHHAIGNAEREVHIVDGASNAAAGLVDRLAMLARDRARQIIEMLLHQVLELPQWFDPMDRRRR